MFRALPFFGICSTSSTDCTEPCDMHVTVQSACAGPVIPMKLCIDSVTAAAAIPPLAQSVASSASDGRASRTLCRQHSHPVQRSVPNRVPGCQGARVSRFTHWCSKRACGCINEATLGGYVSMQSPSPKHFRCQLRALCQLGGRECRGGADWCYWVTSKYKRSVVWLIVIARHL